MSGANTEQLILLELRDIRRILERLEKRTRTKEETKPDAGLMANIKGLDTTERK